MTDQAPNRVVAVLGCGVIDAETPVVHADDLGFTRGDGCFEGLRLHTDSAGVSSVDKLDAHLARLSRSAAALDIELDVARWRDLIEQATKVWSAAGEAGMRLFLTRGRRAGGPPTGVVTIEAMPAVYQTHRRDGISVITLNRGTAIDAFADTPWLLGGVKTMSYAVNMAAQREAARRGADDAILVSVDGWVLESPTGSIVWSLGRTLATTPVGPSGILAGTTQQLLFERAAEGGWQTESAALRVDQLAGVDALWLVGSQRGPVEVNRVDDRARTANPATTAEIQRLAGF